jgi:hypothetical protein
LGPKISGRGRRYRPPMRFPRLALVPLLSCVIASASPGLAAGRKLGVLPVKAGAGVDPKVAEAFTEATAGALAKTGVEVVTQEQWKALLDHEAQKQLAGCTDDACMAQIGEALGVDALVSGTLARVGKSWLVGLRSVEVGSGASRLADRRLKGGTLDDVLDALPALVAELAGGAPAPGASPAGAAGSPLAASAGGSALVVPPAAAAAPPSSRADLPLEVDKATRGRLQAVTDGRSVTIVYDPKPESSFAPIFVAPAPGKPGSSRLYAQRVFGGGRQGDVSFDVVFWEPRAKAPWQASFGVKEGKAWLQCGDHKIELKPAAMPKGATFHRPRWQRRLQAMARTDEGQYFVVDRAREPEESRDVRLYVGTRGAMSFVKVDTAILEADEQIVLTAAGKLKLGTGLAEWTPAGSATAVRLKALEVEEHARFAYGELGTYPEDLGTPCDPWLGGGAARARP